MFPKNFLTKFSRGNLASSKVHGQGAKVVSNIHVNYVRKADLGLRGYLDYRATI